MKREYPLCEGDGLIRSQAESSALPDSEMSLFEIEKAARDYRSRTIAALIYRFLDWIDAGIQRAKYRDLESYLAESTDLADLEHRMRRMEGEPRNMLPVG